MKSEWKIGILSDIAEVIMGQSPPGNSCNAIGNGIPLLNGPTEFGPHHPNAVQYTSAPKKYAQKGDILFCVRGSTTGRMNWADQTYAIGRGIASIRHKSGQEYQPFLKSVIDYNLPTLLASATGSTFPNIGRNQLANLTILIPPLPEQRAIAHILGTLDDKIELNRRMNETLEAMAQALFKSWFVDFDPVVVNALKAGNPIPDRFAKRACLRRSFGRQAAHYRENPDALGLPEHILRLFPDRFVDSEVGPIPEGWEATTIGAEFDLTMGQSPPGSTYNEKGEGLPFFQGRRDFGFRYPSNRVYCTAPTRIVQAGDTLVSVRAPVGDINMAYETCCVGRGVAAVRHKSGSRSYTYYAMRALGERFKSYEAEGTVFGAINKKQFQNLPSIAPPPHVVSSFEELVYPLDENIRSFEEEIRTLSRTRDTLLPKVISGELRVPDAEKILGEAT